MTNDQDHWEWSLVYGWVAIDVTNTNRVSRLINRFSYGIDQNVQRNLITKEGLQKEYDYCHARDYLKALPDCRKRGTNPFDKNFISNITNHLKALVSMD